MIPFFYTAKTSLPKGEIIYLTIETIHPSWEVYVNFANILLSGGNQFIGTNGGLLELYNEKVSNLNTFLATRSFPHFWNQDKKLFDQIYSALKNQNFQKGSNKYKELLSITHASSGMNVRRQTHVVYASKYPIKKPFHKRESEKEFGLAYFYDLYQDIIMSVGVTINEETGMVENRGIFRNPLSIITNDYRGISILLHGFTCEMTRRFFQCVNIFSVRPMQKMAEMLFVALPKII